MRLKRIRGATDLYLIITDIFEYLSGIYKEVNRENKARRKYRVLYQNTNSKFVAFKNNILRLIGIIKYKDNYIRDNICD